MAFASAPSEWEGFDEVPMATAEETVTAAKAEERTYRERRRWRGKAWAIGRDEKEV